MKSTSQYKADAKLKMNKAWGMSICILLLGSFISSSVSGILSLPGNIFRAISKQTEEPEVVLVLLLLSLVCLLIKTLLSSLVTGPIGVGTALAMTKISREKEVTISDLFLGFNQPIGYKSAFELGLRTNIYVFLWSLLLVFPGIIKSYAYSMAPYIMADNPGITGKQALKASEKLMDGKKSRFFELQLSFIGWSLLGLLTCGILNVLWVEPWAQISYAEFYNSIKHEVEIEDFTTKETLE